jgi:hypothetical protein
MQAPMQALGLEGDLEAQGHLTLALAVALMH